MSPANVMNDTPAITETDPRFPSGKWVGFFVHQGLPEKFPTELDLRFSMGKMTGTGSDRVGNFDVDGKYELSDGKCEWIKKYVGKHSVDYRGFNEGKGIWGTWTIVDDRVICKGGFHIWPIGMGTPSDTSLSEAHEIPWQEDIEHHDFVEEPELVPMG